MLSFKLVIAYFLTALVFFAVDMVWLGFLAKDFYRKHLGNFLSPEVNWKAAIVFYLMFIAGIFLFVIFPAVEKGSWLRALVMGGLFGLVTYATYDLTNMALLINWPLKIVIVDILWGVVLVGTVGAAGFKIVMWLGVEP